MRLSELGYPGRDVCMKPLEGKGARGFRVLSASVDRRAQLLDARPGTLLPISMEEAVEILSGGPGFPPMLVMELIEGEELAVDALCRDGRALAISAKTREAFRAGLAMEFRLIDRPDLIVHASRLIEELGLDWLVNVQFLGDRLLEVNPRVSTLVYQDDLNLPGWPSSWRSRRSARMTWSRPAGGRGSAGGSPATTSRSSTPTPADAPAGAIPPRDRRPHVTGLHLHPLRSQPLGLLPLPPGTSRPRTSTTRWAGTSPGEFAIARPTTLAARGISSHPASRP